jgi:hypothetical protein
MSGYKKPKNHLHREFAYLNHDTVINSLSALEAGKVDEIIEKTSEAREGGVSGGLTATPVKLSGGRKKSTDIQEELVRTRTWFSAFDAWFRVLDSADALGVLDGWDRETRDELSVGDTIRFSASVTLSPVHKLITTLVAFANNAGQADSVFKMAPKEVADVRKTARMASSWTKGPDGRSWTLVYLAPCGVGSPRVLARLDEQYLVGGLTGIEGEFTVIAQVEALVSRDDQFSVIRIIRDAPSTPKEASVVTESLESLMEAGEGLGVAVTSEDLTIQFPAVVLHPIAIFR